jgi:DNA-binding CsgD family transcriptional regulator
MTLSLLGRCQEALALRAGFAGMETDTDTTALFFLAIWLEVSVRCGDRVTAAALSNRLAHLGDRLDGCLLVSYGRLLGQAAVMLGRAGQARDYYEQALDVCSRARCRPELALTRLALAELLLAEFPDDQAMAVEQLRMAISEFDSMHVQPSLTRALELGRSVAPARFRPATTTSDLVFADLIDALTHREREVATLLSQGKSNREIATTLVISESTAEVHVKHVLSKLGLRSRSQVAAWAAQRNRPG